MTATRGWPPSPSDGPGAHADGGVESDDARSLPLDGGGGVAAADAQHDLGEDRTEADYDRPGGAGAAHHGSATCVKVEVGARLAPSDAGTPTAAGEGGEALPVPSDAGDGDARPVTSGSRPLEKGTEADDGLPSFSPDVAESPAGPDDEQGPEGAVTPSPNGETPLINDGLSLLPLADETRGIDDQDGGTRTPEVGGEGLARYEGAAAVGAPPPGVVSPPAVTVFGGGLGAAIGPGSPGDAIVAHPVEVSESDSDLEAPLEAPTPTAPAAPMDDDVRQSAGGALQ